VDYKRSGLVKKSNLLRPLYLTSTSRTIGKDKECPQVGAYNESGSSV
jgi:hypothetical protein